MRRAFVLALLVAVFACSGLANAQTLTGTVTGKITDQQGGVLPGVTVTLTGKTGAQTQVTDSQGVYRFIGLQPGTYTLKTELQGFKPKEQQNIDVSISKTVEIPLQLAVGGVSETVDVVANAITVDTTTTATDTNMSQDLLFSMPITHNNPAVNVLNYSPGINSGSAFGGASDGGNSLMLDGVDTRDPEGGTAWTFFNYNIIEEVQVGGLGQPAEYGGFTGAVVNTITKSGGNRFSFLSEMRFTGDWAAGNNTTPQLIEENALLGFPAVDKKMTDYTVQMGGPVKKDKVFFFASVQRYSIDTQQSGSQVIRSEISPRFNIKFTYQPTANDNIVGSLQYDNYNQKGRIGFLIPSYAATQDSTSVQDSPEYIYNAQYRKVFNSSTFLEAKYTGWWGYYDLNAVNTAPAHFDGLTGVYSGGYGYVYQADRTRNQVNVALTKYAQFAGTHNFKFGMEIERSPIRDRFAYNTAYFYDYGGPYYAYGYSYDLQGKNKRESYYAQDQWKINRLTLNLGLRLDNIRGESTVDGKQIYSTFSAGPRLGFAWDVTGKGSSVVKGFYGQYYDAANFSIYSRAVPGLSPSYVWAAGPNSTLIQPPVETTAKSYTVASDVNHPRVDEINFTYEQQFMRDYKLTVTGIKRDWKNFINSTLPGSTWAPYAYTNPMTSQPMTLYSWVNRTDVPAYTITNVGTVNYPLAAGGAVSTPESYRSYRGLMLVFQRALRNRWQAQLSYVYSKTKGSVDNGTYSGISSGQFENPNTSVINTDGYASYDRTHEFKLFAGYQIPKIEVAVNGYFRYMSGRPYTIYSRVRARNLNLPGSYVLVNLEEPGAHRNDPFNQTDIRFEKVFTVGFHRFGVYADIVNLFNQSIVTARQNRWPNRNFPVPDPNNPGSFVDNIVEANGPVSMMPAVQATFGLRWSF
jgi:hypothetical protein